MNKVFLFLTMPFLYNCSQVKIKPSPSSTDDDQVSIVAALDQAQMSYLKGCVDAFRSLNIPQSFETCRDKAILHRQEIEGIINQPDAELR